jgi:hypothetical protein
MVTDFGDHSTNLVIVLGMMQVSKRIPFEEPNVLLSVRVCYVASNVLLALLYFYMQMRVNSKKGMTCLPKSLRRATPPPPVSHS